MEREMIRSYRAGCTDPSVPAAFPAKAKADRTLESNQCHLVQVGIFQQ